MKLAFLLDANLSPETAEFLRSFGYDAKSLIEKGLGNLDDASVVMVAQKEKRILITFDLDFGEMYYFAAKKKFDVIVMRLKDQRPQSVNTALKIFLESYRDVFEKKARSLVIVSETRIRITSY